MRISRRCLFAVPAAIVLLGAYEPVHAPPAGYEKNCYGGNYQRTYLKSRTFVTFLVHAPESEWPELAKLLADFGGARKLQVFDTSIIQDNLHFFGVSLCHADGLFVYAAKQNWRINKPYDPWPEKVNLLVSAYANHERWQPLAEELAAHLQQNWKADVAVSWQPEPAPAPPSAAK